MKESPLRQQVLVLWNDDLYAKLLREKYPEVHLITSLDDLMAAETGFIDYTGAIVLLELCWNRNPYSRLQGIEIVKTIFRAQKKIRFPVLFVSFLSISKVLLDENSNKSLENQIVGAVGHGFSRLPSTLQDLLSDLKKLIPLNELQFADIFSNLCNVKGLITGRIHELQGHLQTLENSSDEFKITAAELVENFLNEITNLLKEEAISDLVTQFRKGFGAKISNKETSHYDVQEFLEQFGGEISALITEDRDDRHPAEFSQEKFEKQPWKILLLDDEPVGLTTLRKTLERRGIDCFLAKTVEEAKRIIKEDVFNEITVSISDYRLLEITDGIEKHQPWQGYDFLLWLTTQDHFAHLIALSGLSRKFLLESFQKYVARVDVYSKQDLADERAVSLFVDNIVDRGQEIYEVICSHPTVGDWKSIKPFYAAHRNSTEYRLREQEINNRASRYVRQYEELLESRDEIHLLQPNLEKLGELTTKLTGKKTNDPRSMETFYSKLVGRRIALWLHLKLGFSRNEVFAALKGYLNPASILNEIKNELRKSDHLYDEMCEEELNAKIYRKYKDNSTNLVTTNLALSFPMGDNELLVEEKYWLKTEIGIRHFDSQFSVNRQIPYFVQIGFEQFLEIVPAVAQKLLEQNKYFTRSGKLVLVGFEDAVGVMNDSYQATSSESEKKHFQHFLKILNQNIKLHAGSSPFRDDFLELISKLSE